MPLSNVSNDPAAKTVTLTAELDAPVERAWQLYADPHQLEQWWNPPGYPLTITDHDLSVGGMVRAHVTTPDGQKAHAYWRITAVDAPRSMAWEDGFLDDQLEPNAAIPPTTMHLTLADREGGGTLMTIVVGFLSMESMQDYLDMDIEEHMRVTFGQADALLGQLSFVRAPALERAVEGEVDLPVVEAREAARAGRTHSRGLVLTQNL